MFEQRDKPYRRPPATLTLLGRAVCLGIVVVGAVAMAQNAGLLRGILP